MIAHYSKPLSRLGKCDSNVRCEKYMKKLFMFVALTAFVLIAFLVWNKRGFGGQVLHSPTKPVSAWVSHEGWAPLNGKYVLAIVDDNTSETVQELYFGCSSGQFAQMRETPQRYLSWNDEGTAVTLSIPDELAITVEIE